MARDAWRAVADEADAALLEVEIVCSNSTEHRRRVETRATDIPSLESPDWAATQARLYDRWDRPRLVVDTAKSSVLQALAVLRAHSFARAALKRLTPVHARTPRSA